MGCLLGQPQHSWTGWGNNLYHSNPHPHVVQLKGISYAGLSGHELNTSNSKQNFCKYGD